MGVVSSCLCTCRVQIKFELSQSQGDAENLKEELSLVKQVCVPFLLNK